jgi:hypothetical protein
MARQKIDPTQPVDDDTAPPTDEGVPVPVHGMTVPEPRDMIDPIADAPGADDADVQDGDEGEGTDEGEPAS